MKACMNKTGLFVDLKAEALSFDILHVLILIQYNKYSGAVNILWKLSKMLVMAGNLKEMLTRKEIRAV